MVSIPMQQANMLQQQQRPFYGTFVQDYLGEPEPTHTYPAHHSLSASSIYYDL